MMKWGRYMSNTQIEKITDKVKMTDEDRAYFKAGVKTLCGAELLFAGNVINDKVMLYEKDGVLYYAGTQKEAISN